MRKTTRSFLPVIILLICQCASIDPPLYEKTEFREISYWLNKIDNPDKIILDRDKIKNLNSRMRDMNNVGSPLAERPLKPGYLVRRIIEADLNWIEKPDKYNIDNTPINNNEFNKKMQDITGLKKIPQTVNIRFGLVTRPAYLRAFPLDDTILTKPDDVYFDILQVSFLDIGEPLAILHVSADSRWAFVLTTHLQGWIKFMDIAWTFDKNMVKEYLSSSDFMVALDSSVPLYDERNNNCFDIHMGAVLPYTEKNNGYFVVRIPIRNTNGNLEFDKGYMKNNGSISTNYLDLTPKNIAKQAFKMIGEPYSWGGKNFKTDCASYLKSIFQTMGLNLPRNGYSQVQSFRIFKMNQNNKADFLNTSEPFQTFLFLPGHVMLYIGKDNNQYYVIHNKWGYKRLNGKEEEEVILKQILVSGLNLGEDSKEGSLFDKLLYGSILK